MVKYIVFAGTTEGRILGAALAEKYNIKLCVATEYGGSVVDDIPGQDVLVGKLDKDAMAALMEKEKPQAVIDATHPYAVLASDNIKAACEASGMKYIRVLRTMDKESEEGISLFDSLEDLVEYLKGTEGVIFSTLGAKEIPALTALEDFRDRVWARVLPMQSSLDICTAAGLLPKHTICMQGPFSEELNMAMFRAAGASIMITKLTGRSGGFNEKISAAKKLGMQCCVIKRPDDSGIPFEDALEMIKKGEL